MRMKRGRFKKIEDLNPGEFCCEWFRGQVEQTAGEEVRMPDRPGRWGHRACSRCGYISPKIMFVWTISRDGRPVLMPAEFLDVDEGS